MAIPLILIASAASMIADQAKKSRERAKLAEEARWQRGGLVLEAANHGTEKLGGDSFIARQLRKGDSIDRDVAMAEQQIDGEGMDMSALLGLVGQGASALGGIGGGGSSPELPPLIGTPGNGEEPISSFDFSGAGDVAAAPYQFAEYGGGAAAAPAAPAAAAGAGAVTSIFDEINAKYRRRW